MWLWIGTGCGYAEKSGEECDGGIRDVTALRCSEPLRYKVGGASKPSPYFAGWDRLGNGGGEGDKSGMLL